MSALTSAMATRWSGVSTYGKASSISACHGVSCPNAKPSALTRFWYSTTSSWAISRTARADAALGLGEVAAAEAVQRRRLAADVLAQHVDLVRRHVQLVVALVGDEQVVALDAADRALDHALVAADAVLDVDDVVARLEVLEEAGAVASARPRPAVGAAAAGEVALGDDRQLGRRQRDAVVQRGDDDVAAGPGEVAGGAAVHRRGRGRGRAAARRGGRPSPRRRRRRRRGSRRRAAGSGGRRARSRRRRPGPTPTPATTGVSGRLRRRVDRPRRRRARSSRRSGSACRRGNGLSGSRSHVDASALARSSSSASRSMARSRIRRGSTSTTLAVAGSTSVSSCSPSTSHGSQLSMPSNRAPSARRSHCSRPHGSAPTSFDARARTSSVGISSRAGKMQRLVEVVGRALVVDAEAGQAVDLVAPQVDADRGVAGRREDVDDRAPPGELAAVLDELLAAVAERRRGGRRARRGRRRRRGGRRSARSTWRSGPRRCSRPRTPVTIDGRDGARGRAAATAPRGAGPSSRPTG